LEKILDLKKEFPDAEFIAHPECEKPLLLVADFIGSTTALLNYSIRSDSKRFIVATESGILHQMRKSSPGKVFIPAPSVDSTCGCNDCSFMKLNTLEKLFNTLKYEKPEIKMDSALMDKARKPIMRMLEISKKLKS
jgi:quinolinate synthase